MLCGSLDGRGDGERMDTHISMAEILHRSPLFSYFYSAIYGFMDNYLCLSYNPIVYYLFYCSTCSSLGLWELFIWLLCLCDIPLLLCYFCSCCLLIYFEHFLPGIATCSGLILYVSFPVLESAIYLKALSLLMENGIRKQDLGPKFALCYWDTIIFRPCQLTERGDVCILSLHTHTHTHTLWW